MQYPQVINEEKTLSALLLGASIARFGDGEFRIALGGRQNVSQVTAPRLREELCEILVNKQSKCLIAIPTMDPNGPKWGSWKKYENNYPRLLSSKKTYYSSFITRPDSAPAIDYPGFYDHVEALWADKDIILVRGSERSFVEGRASMLAAKSVMPVLCSRRDAYSEIDRVERDVMDLVNSTGCRIVILCAGAMATVLAYRLSKHNIQAMDLGHMGYLWRYYQSKKQASL